MAQSINWNGIPLVIPGAFVQTTVQNNNSGLATTGVLMIVGEADSGLDYTQETDINNVTFGPDQQADVIAKYSSGNIVDAFRGAVAAADDPQIQGSFNSIIIMKTNAGTKASSDFNKVGGGVYGTFFDRSYGKNGNLINYTITQSTAEDAPSTGLFTVLLPIAAYDMSVRVNGGASEGATISALETPDSFVSAVGALGDITATGGAARTWIAVSGTLAMSVVSGNTVTITRSVNWANNPVAGDTLYIPSGSIIAGGSGQNEGSYVVVSATNSTVNATKLRNASGSPGTVTAPVNVSATNIAATTDLQGWAPVEIAVTAGSPVSGIGKSLEINALTTNTDVMTNYCYQLNVNPVTFISTSSAPVALASSAEYGVNVNVARASSNVNQNIDVEGQVALRIGYTGTTCSLSIVNDTLTTSVSGGSGSNLSVNLNDFATIADVATYINAQPGYVCSAANASLGLNPAIILDDVTASCASTFGALTGRVKIDAYNFFTDISQGSSLVQLNNPPAQALSGLPDVQSLTFLAGGARGATANSDVFGAMDRLQSVQGNFLIPLFSVDASKDITLGNTDSGSSYTIDAINAYANTHVLLMSQIKRRKNRQAFCSKQDTFDAVKNAAANIASARTSMAFQDMKDVGLTGIEQFQPWMSAMKAAGMQAAGFYRAIFNKGINCSGVLQNAGDYNDQEDSQVEQALENGLLPAKRRVTGGYTWVSDQTTYTLDSNFVFNSIQAVYAADIAALTIAQRMEQAFLGQSLADVSSAIALSALSGICFDLLRQKILAPSDGAPSGFSGASVRIVGPVMYCSLNIFLATGLYFIPISIMVQEVTSSASQGANQ